ncbi:MAG: hypothetical protein SYC29_04170 [Planctomycetota bacterium]|nr:hypothetical protein [Planctomycetota bacterium]
MENEIVIVDDFRRPDMKYHGDGWESLNPGYWEIRNGALRRRLNHVGDHNPTTSFPWHWSQGGKAIDPVAAERDPTLPFGMIWRRDWWLTGDYTIIVDATIRALPQYVQDRPWRNQEPGYACFGVCFGGESLYESRDWTAKPGDGSWMALLYDDGRFGVFDHAQRGSPPAWENGVCRARAVEPGQRAHIEVRVHGEGDQEAAVTARLVLGDREYVVRRANVNRARLTDGRFGLAARGQLDVEINRVRLEPRANRPARVALNELHTCYPLGDTLRCDADGRWRCRMIALFRNPGEEVSIRVADREQPAGGWIEVPVAGTAGIVDNDFRRYTASVDVRLPCSPAEKTLYFTVWKDGRNVTEDPRPGFLGRKRYVGRLPRLAAPYRMCTLGGHAIHGGRPDLPRTGTYQAHWIHGQPCRDAYRHFEAYDFQIINWDDDVWYLELLFPPPSTDDAYRIITLTIAEPTARWMMMRHWNVLNPGDHDYGMDDIKGPEQILVRQRDDLGQDSAYMRRNFNINQHLVTGTEERTGAANPRNWRHWKLPDGDFSIYVVESRLWRGSQDTNLWVRTGWTGRRALYDRRNPTRTLLGEEQFAWLSEKIRTDTAPLICVTGINCLHPIFTGGMIDRASGYRFADECRIAADYAGWVTAGADRVLNLLGSRSGIISVYGDIHLASIVRNRAQRVIECSCGPIGRTGSRGLIRGFGPRMRDVDGRDVDVLALYHDRYGNPALQPRSRDKPQIWNFLEQEFDSRGSDPHIRTRIRHIEDPPGAGPRGGGVLDLPASATGRPPMSRVPAIRTLPNADVHLMRTDGRPLRGTRSLADGSLPLTGLPDVAPHTALLMVARSGEQVQARVIHTVRPNPTQYPAEVTCPSGTGPVRER